MTSARAREGWLLIDNRNAPPVDAETIRRTGREFISPGVGVYESATVTCSHCHAVVVLNPQRTRERAWCWSCDRYLCDACGFRAKTEGCRNFNKLLGEAQTAAIRKEVFRG